MAGFVDNIDEITLSNNNFRQVIYTGQYSQIVIMSLNPNENIGMEVHPTTDQFLRIEKGEGEVIMNGEKSLIKEGSAVFVPAGIEHNIVNTSAVDYLKLYTIYSPPHHKDGVIHETKQNATNDRTDHL